MKIKVIWEVKPFKLIAPDILKDLADPIFRVGHPEKQAHPTREKVFVNV
jgi:hypothetical protein